MEQRAREERRAGEEVKVVLMGGSQICRLKEGLLEWSNGGVRVVGVVRILGELTDMESDRALNELAGIQERPDKVVVGGPTNSLMTTVRETTRASGQKEQWW
jgi:hypothetical protein